MKKWEYKIVEFEEFALNAHGEQGWEAVGMSHRVLNAPPSFPPAPPPLTLAQPTVLMKRPL